MNEITPEGAMAFLEDDKRKRRETAANAVQDALTAYHCDIVAVPQITPDGRIVAVVQIIAR